jgi:hypothetical protein
MGGTKNMIYRIEVNFCLLHRLRKASGQKKGTEPSLADGEKNDPTPTNPEAKSIPASNTVWLL